MKQSNLPCHGLAVLMRANLDRYTSGPKEHTVLSLSNTTAQAPARQGHVPWANQQNDRTTQQLVWILISLLLLLYLATGYVFWAKIESAWPVFR
jgi:hypothetical protein